MQAPGDPSAESGEIEASCVETGGRLDPVTGDILTQVMTELATMMSLLGRTSARRRIREIQVLVRALLHRTAGLIRAGEIDPWVRLRMSSDDPPVSRSEGTLRIGVFPLSANPIHWGHLLSGLSAMDHARLDKVVFVLAHDPFPTTELYPEELRRGAAAEAIALFQPLFTLVPPSGKPLDGAASFFRLLGLNGQQSIEAFYISGCESGASASVAETTEALRSQGARTRAGSLHSVSVVRIETGSGEGPSLEDPRFLLIPSAPPEVSTAAVRAAMRSAQGRDELAALPACAFRHLGMLSGLD